MALSTQANQLVKAKAGKALRNAGSAIQLLNKAFWMGLNQEGTTKDLQIVQASNVTSQTVIADTACRLVAVYAKKQATATAAFLKAVNHATTAAGSTFNLCIDLPASGDEVLLTFPKGLAFSNGITICSSTTDAGTTNSTSGDGPDVFFIISA